MMLIGCTLAFTLVAADVSLPRRRVLEEATIERHGAVVCLANFS